MSRKTLEPQLQPFPHQSSSPNPFHLFLPGSAGLHSAEVRVTPGPWGLSLPPAQSPRTPRNTRSWYLQHGKNSSVSFRHLSIRKGKKKRKKKKPFFSSFKIKPYQYLPCISKHILHTIYIIPMESFHRRNSQPSAISSLPGLPGSKKAGRAPAFPRWGCAKRGANAAAPEICTAPTRVHAPLGLCWPWCGVWHCGQHNLTKSTTATSHPDSQQTHHEEVSSLLTDCLTRGPSPQGRMFLTETFALQYRAADRCTKARDCDILSTPRQI